MARRRRRGLVAVTGPSEGTTLWTEDFETWLPPLVEGVSLGSDNFDSWTGAGWTIFEETGAGMSHAKVAGALDALPGTDHLEISGGTGNSSFKENTISAIDSGAACFCELAGNTVGSFGVLVRVTAQNPITAYAGLFGNSASGLSLRIIRYNAGVFKLLTRLYHARLSDPNSTWEVWLGVKDSGTNAIVELQARRVSTEPMLASRLLLVDPQPIAGPGGVGFFSINSAFGGFKHKLDNWRAFNVS